MSDKYNWSCEKCSRIFFAKLSLHNTAPINEIWEGCMMNEAHLWSYLFVLSHFLLIVLGIPAKEKLSTLQLSPEGDQLL